MSPPSNQDAAPTRGRRILEAALARSPAQPLFLWRAARSLTVLAYHDVTDPERFTIQLDHLVESRRPISLSELDEALDGGGLPRRAVLVTFDDGDPSVLEVAAPLLAERGVPAVVFVVTDLLGTEAPPWWLEAQALWLGSGHDDPANLVRRMKRMPDPQRRKVLAELRTAAPSPPPPQGQLRHRDLRELESRGLAIGNHTASHPCLPHCDLATLRQEISTAHECLTSSLGHPPTSFAFPNGDEDLRARPLLGDLGYRSAFLFDHRLSRWPVVDRLRISRVRVSTGASLDRFKILLSGLHPALFHALRLEGRAT